MLRSLGASCQGDRLLHAMSVPTGSPGLACRNHQRASKSWEEMHTSVCSLSDIHGGADPGCSAKGCGLSLQIAMPGVGSWSLPTFLILILIKSPFCALLSASLRVHGSGLALGAWLRVSMGPAK